jgi:polyphenol oxidase
MIHRYCNGIHWQEFELLADAPIVHGCFMRHGGVSQAGLESLNLGRSVGDKPENVVENFARISNVLSLNQMISAKLCHGASVTALTAANIHHLPISDGLTTAFPNVAIAVTQADCQAAIFYDPMNHVLANVHCGWRGSVQNIYAATVASMKGDYGSNPANLMVCISPSLGPAYAEFSNYRTELPESFWQFKSKNDCFDFWEISRWQLEKAGVLPQHIEIAQIDTYASKDYFSHRRATHEGGSPCGRQATICALKPH